MQVTNNDQLIDTNKITPPFKLELDTMGYFRSGTLSNLANRYNLVFDSGLNNPTGLENSPRNMALQIWRRVS